MPLPSLWWAFWAKEGGKAIKTIFEVMWLIWAWLLHEESAEWALECDLYKRRVGIMLPIMWGHSFSIYLLGSLLGSNCELYPMWVWKSSAFLNHTVYELQLPWHYCCVSTSLSACKSHRVSPAAVSVANLSCHKHTSLGDCTSSVSELHLLINIIFNCMKTNSMWGSRGKKKN